MTSYAAHLEPMVPGWKRQFVRARFMTGPEIRGWWRATRSLRQDRSRRTGRSWSAEPWRWAAHRGLQAVGIT